MFQHQTALAKVRLVGCTAVTFVHPSLSPSSLLTPPQLLGEYASDLGSASVQIACEYGLQIAGWEAVLKNCGNIVRWVNDNVS